MKSITIFCFFFILLTLINTVWSYSNGKTRLFDILRKKDNALLSYLRFYEQLDTTSTITPLDSELESVEREEQMTVQTRDSWDSGEDQYFKWASLNRRPMESLVGRKRSLNSIVTRGSPSRVKAGVWRSGLVG